jgi:hypothetical protein
MAKLSARELLTVLKEVEARGIHETARKLRTAIGAVFRYAIATARAENDPTTAFRGALVTPTVTPRAAIVATNTSGGLLRAIEDYQGGPRNKGRTGIARRGQGIRVSRGNFAAGQQLDDGLQRRDDDLLAQGEPLNG